jgi:hypothetical protein
MRNRGKKIGVGIVLLAGVSLFLLRPKPVIDPAVKNLPDFLNEGQVLGRASGPDYMGRPQNETAAIYTVLDQKEVEGHFEALRAQDPKWKVKRLPTGVTSFYRMGSSIDNFTVTLHPGKREVRMNTYPEVLPKTVDPKGTTLWIQAGQAQQTMLERFLTFLRP